METVAKRCEPGLLCVCVQNPGSDLADAYVTFIRQNQDILRNGVSEELHLQKVFDVSPH